MEIELAHQSSYPHRTIDLDASEPILAEPGAMVSYTLPVSVDHDGDELRGHPQVSGGDTRWLPRRRHDVGDGEQPLLDKGDDDIGRKEG